MSEYTRRYRVQGQMLLVDILCDGEVMPEHMGIPALESQRCIWQLRNEAARAGQREPTQVAVDFKADGSPVFACSRNRRTRRA